MSIRRTLPILAALACACGEDPEAIPGTTAAFDPAAELGVAEAFYDMPWPSDLRLSAGGGPDLTGFPRPFPNAVVDGLLPLAAERKGFPTVPVAYFKFSAPLAPRDPEAIIAGAKESPILLVDVDEASPERGRLFPTVSATPPPDAYLPENVLAVAPRPGFVLHGRRKYALVIQRSLMDAAGKKLGVPLTVARLSAGEVPSAAEDPDDETPHPRAVAAKPLYASLWKTLGTLKIDAKEVAAATVFTTGDVVADNFAMTEALLAKHQVSITGLALDPTDGASHERYCELHGSVKNPQFQSGTPPFDTGGLFQLTDGGLPAKQRDEDSHLVLTLPKGQMPAGGYPLMVYFHGSGGLSTGMVDRGASTDAADPGERGKGPAHVVAAFGIAGASSALPVNPQRLPGASEIAYINFNNFPALRDTFRQGVIEQRLLIAALRTLEIPPSALDGCGGISLPVGETSYRFAPDKLVASGQSMGGMYTNMVSAVEPRIRAAVPTGAGGFWSYFILRTTLFPGVTALVRALLKAEQDPVTFMHPGMQLFETAVEPADPMVAMPRLGRDPLPGHPVRPVYEPVGKGDSYFPTTLYDAIALAYGHQQAGDLIWPSMQDALALAGLGGILPYPVRMNRPSLAGGSYTGVVVQYEGDGFYDPHAIYRQLDAVKYQYGCFLSTFLATGTAVVPAPAPLGTACPQ